MTNNSIKLKTKAIVHLKVTIEGVPYILGTLRFNRGELSYFLIHPCDKTHFSQLNLNTGKPTAKFEHITWHTNRIHIKLQDGSILDPIELSEPLLSVPPILTPLYVESIYFDGDPPLQPAKNFVSWKGAVTEEILAVNSLSNFSLVLLLTPETHPTPWVLSNLKIKVSNKGIPNIYSCASLCTEIHRPGRIYLWNGWDMIVLTTPFVQKNMGQIPPEIGTKFRIPNYKNVRSALSNLIIQSSY